MESKFKVGDEVYYMAYATPRKETITGIASIVGKFKDLDSPSKEVNNDTPTTYYCIGYAVAHESEVFATKEELQNHLFKDL